MPNNRGKEAKEQEYKGGRGVVEAETFGGWLAGRLSGWEKAA